MNGPEWKMAATPPPELGGVDIYHHTGFSQTKDIYKMILNWFTNLEDGDLSCYF